MLRYMKTVAVVFGGRTAEHDVSIITALTSIIKPLELVGNYNIEPVYIAKNGNWFWDEKLKDVALYQTNALADFMQHAPKARLLFDRGLHLVLPGKLGRVKQTNIDIVFPAMHGTYGEDGALMGLLDMASVPYVGCGVSAAAVAMDKVLCKQVAFADGIASTPWTWFYAHELASDQKRIVTQIEKLRYPLFVKPALLGSSIGITRVTNKIELQNALEVAAHYDDKIVVEEAVPHLIEVTLPIIGNNTPVPALLEQPLTHSEDFFDFDTKYMNGGKKAGGQKLAGERGAQGYSTLPADIPKDLYAKAEAIGLATYRALGCTGIARVDLLINGKTGDVYMNEVNPLPGSLYAHNWRAKGMSGVELVEELLRLGFERFEARAKLQTSFSTNFLQQF
jgi:D-alanine-D-alanine ligase